MLTSSILLAFVILPFLLFGAELSAWATQVMQSARNRALAMGLTIGLLATDVVLPVPSSIIACLAGQCLGFTTALAGVWIGLSMSNVLGMELGRRVGERPLARLHGIEDVARLRRLLSGRPGLLAIAALRPVPVLSEASVILAGATGMPRRGVMISLTSSNLGLAALYAGVGSMSVELHLPWLAPLAGVVLPGVLALAAPAILDVREPAAANEAGRP